MPRRRTVLLGLAAGLASPGAARALAPAGAARFTADLSGTQAPANTGSKATGHADIAVDLAAQTVALDLAVHGITQAQLWDKLTAAPIGPIHFHHYGQVHHMDDASVTLVFPVPYGPAYADAPGGFVVRMSPMPYAAGAALLKSDVPFAAFVDQLRAGLVALNVHTDAFPGGEINGPVVPA
jgi:hypothetical protein